MENTDEIAEKKISVTVKSLSRKELFEAESTWTVTHFKEIISPRFDQTPVDQLTLIFAGKILKDSTTLDENKIRDGLTVHLVMRAKKEAEEAVEPNVGSGITEQPSIRATLLGNLESSLPPMVGDLLNSREALRLWELASNPAVADEMAHMQDRALRNIESIPGGYGALQRLYHEVQEPLEDAMQDQFFNNPFTFLSSTNNAPNLPPGAENRVPLPNPWSNSDPASNLFTSFGPRMFNSLDAPPNLEGIPANAFNRLEERFPAQLAQLLCMGFSNREANILALCMSDGDVDGAIDKLLYWGGQA